MPLSYFKNGAKILLSPPYLQIFSTKNTKKLYFFYHYPTKSDRKNDFHHSFCLIYYSNVPNAE